MQYRRGRGERRREMESGQMWILHIILHPGHFSAPLASACRCRSFISLFFQVMCDYLKALGKHKSTVACQIEVVVISLDAAVKTKAAACFGRNKKKKKKQQKPF